MQTTESAYREGVLDWIISDRLEVLSKMATTFPELADRPSLWQTLTYYLPHQFRSQEALADVYRPLFSSHPDRIGEVVSTVVEGPQEEVGAAQARLLEMAVIEFGYRPTPEQTTYLLSRLIRPALEVWEPP